MTNVVGIFLYKTMLKLTDYCNYQEFQKLLKIFNKITSHFFTKTLQLNFNIVTKPSLKKSQAI